MRGFLQDDFDCLDRVGLVSNEVVQNETYREALTGIMSFTGAFDFAVEPTTSYSDSLLEPGLERLYIDSWAENTETLDEGGRRVLELAAERSTSSLDQGEVESLAKYALTTPVYFETSKWDHHFRHIPFDTHHRNDGGGFESSGRQAERAERILRTLREQYGLVPKEDND